MDYNTNILQFGEKNFKFIRVKNGYSPEEVDMIIETQQQKIDMLAREKDDLTNENNRLEQTLNKCNAKIGQLEQNTQLIEKERQKEKTRLVSIMTNASRTAEETLEDARRKSEEIIADANLEIKQLVHQAVLDAKIVYKELASITEIIRTARESSNRHYDRLDGIMQNAADIIDGLVK